MSIRDEINWRKSEGRLVVFSARIQWEQCRRVILMTQDVDADLNKPREIKDEIKRWAFLEADMSWFVEGGYVNRDFLKQLTPRRNEIWTLRSVRPRPSLRVFGRFAEPDVFIATHVVERATLGAKNSHEYQTEIRRCMATWSQLFTHPPFSGEKHNDYITENAQERTSI